MNIKEALASGGALLTIGAFILGNFTGEQVQPVDSLHANSPAEERFNPCPSGWDFTEEADHVRILTCAKNGWVVSLNADFTFNNGLNTQGPGSTTNPAEVPGWR